MYLVILSEILISPLSVRAGFINGRALAETCSKGSRVCCFGYLIRHFRARMVLGALAATIFLIAAGATAMAASAVNNAQSIPVTTNHVACLTVEAHDKFAEAVNAGDVVQGQLLLNSLRCVYIKGRQFRTLKRVGAKMQVRVYGKVGSIVLWMANNLSE